MAKRSGNPALYEMMRSRGTMPTVPGVPAPRHPPLRVAEEVEVMRDDASPSPMLERLVSLLSPGHALRVPVGYLLLACGVTICLLMLTYAVGFSGGKSKARAEFEEKWGSAPPSMPGVNDPLTMQATERPTSDTGQGGLLDQRSGANSTAPLDAGTRNAASWGPVAPNVDPRQKGWNYFIVAENTLQRATRLAEFCRANGLETYVVPGKNGSRVIAFPGFQGARDAQEVKRLEERIHLIGDKYKAANKYETNMHDAYPAKYEG